VLGDSRSGGEGEEQVTGPIAVQVATACKQVISTKARLASVAGIDRGIDSRSHRRSAFAHAFCAFIPVNRLVFSLSNMFILALVLWVSV
jgi:hypothetical protein